MTGSEAIKALYNGKKIRRKSWKEFRFLNRDGFNVKLCQDWVKEIYSLEKSFTAFQFIEMAEVMIEELMFSDWEILE